MTIELKLDEKAVAVLFPEGTEARVRLQNAVIDQIVRRYITKDFAEMQRIVGNRVHELFAEELNKKGIQTSGFGREMRLGDAAKAAIKQQAESAWNAAVLSGLSTTPGAIEKIREEAFKKIGDKLDQELTFGLERRINDMVKKALRGAINA